MERFSLTPSPGSSTSYDNDEPEVDETHFVAIEGDADDFDDIETLCWLDADAPGTHYERRRRIALVRNAPPRQTDQTVETYMGNDDRSRAMLVPDETFAIGYFIGLCELHEADETETNEYLADTLPEMYDAYQDWLSEQSTRDRRLRLLDQAEESLEQMEFYRPALDAGSWRETGLSGGAKRLADRIYAEVDPNPKFCYKNALRAVHGFWENDRVQYCEGIALPKHGVRIVGHAWLEIDGHVAELTWPWHATSPPDEAIYYGVPIPRDRLEGADTERGEPMLLDVDDISKLG